MLRIKFGTIVICRGVYSHQEMMVTSVAASGDVVGCIWPREGGGFWADRFLASELEAIGSYSPEEAQAIRMAYEQG
jgi:hypothetical protein